MRNEVNSFPLNHQRHRYHVVAYRTFFSVLHFYRQIYRHLHLIPKISIQHLSARVADYDTPIHVTLQDRSGSIGTYRWQRLSRPAIVQYLLLPIGGDSISTANVRR